MKEQFEMLCKGFKKMSLMFKALLIGFMILILLIPTAMVEGLIRERQNRSNEVVREISDKWGLEQTVTGPILSVPFTATHRQKINHKYVNVEYRDCAHFYADDLKIKTHLKHELRERSIFKAMLYHADLQLSGQFSKAVIEEFIATKNGKPHYDQASLSFACSDVRGVTNEVKVQFDQKRIAVKPGLKNKPIKMDGFHSPLKLDMEKELWVFDCDFQLQGSDSFFLSPTGRKTNIEMTSTWGDPSFVGSFLPLSHDIRKDGFSAKWSVHELQKSSEQSWSGQASCPTKMSSGVKLLQTNSFYQAVSRIVKYAILFIAFTFAGLFITERLTKKTVHPIQYLIAGIAVLIFYVLVLSISEHQSFNLAYLISSVLTTLSIGLYMKGVFRTWKVAGVLMAVIGGLYAFLFVILQLEDYALMMGSGGLFIILATVMYLTRDLNVQMDEEEEGVYVVE